MEFTKEQVNWLRAVVALRVVVHLFIENNHNPVGQLTIIPAEGDSLTQQEWDALGLGSEYPYGITTPAQLTSAIVILRDCGWMLPNPGNKPKGGTYAPTEAGIALVERLGDDWQQWGSRGDYCGG